MLYQIETVWFVQQYAIQCALDISRSFSSYNSWKTSLMYGMSFVGARCKSDLKSWWRHQMATFSALLAISAGNSPVPGEFPAQRPVTRSFDVFFDLRPNKRLSKQSWGWWSETPSSSLWRHHNAYHCHALCIVVYNPIVSDRDDAIHSKVCHIKYLFVCIFFLD